MYNTCMNVNYDLLFNEYINSADRNFPQRLLLHACCAPCSTQCLTRLLDIFDVTLYYANDNITDFDEWQKRLEELNKLANLINNGLFEKNPIRPLKLQVKPFDSDRFFKAVSGQENEREGGVRCSTCFKLRFADTALFAEENGFDVFTTTLTVSPYKNSKIINETGLALQNEKIRWLPSDFKKQNGYAESIRLSQKYNLYRQHYCGCEFSLLQMQNKL